MAASPTWHRDRTPPPFGRKRITAGAFSATSPDVKRPGHSQQHHSGPISGPFSETPAFGPASPNQAVIAARHGQRSFSSAVHRGNGMLCLSLRLAHLYPKQVITACTKPGHSAAPQSAHTSRQNLPSGITGHAGTTGVCVKKTSARKPPAFVPTHRTRNNHQTHPTHSNRLTRPNPKGHRQ